jgi:hypothetical protein
MMCGLFEQVFESQEGPDALIQGLFIEDLFRHGKWRLVCGCCHVVVIVTQVLPVRK